MYIGFLKYHLFDLKNVKAVGFRVYTILQYKVPLNESYMIQMYLGYTKCEIEEYHSTMSSIFIRKKIKNCLRSKFYMPKKHIERSTISPSAKRQF